MFGAFLCRLSEVVVPDDALHFLLSLLQYTTSFAFYVCYVLPLERNPKDYTVEDKAIIHGAAYRAIKKQILNNYDLAL